VKKSFYLLMTLISVNAYAQQQTEHKLDPATTEVWDLKPKVVTPAASSSDAPSDAIVLFDGKDMLKWSKEDGSAAAWNLKDGVMSTGKSAGNIKTKQTFGDFQLHIEWRTPSVVVGNGQGRGNSGIFLQERYELQVLDSYDNETYSNGQAGAIYKQSIPLVNVCRKPGEWQSYDIIYTAPRFSDNGRVVIPAYVTVLQNGVLVQNHTQINGHTEYMGMAVYQPHGKGSILLQDHGNPVGYRNIWIREL